MKLRLLAASSWMTIYANIHMPHQPDYLRAGNQGTRLYMIRRKPAGMFWQEVA